jgi:hypothetical protein
VTSFPPHPPHSQVVAVLRWRSHCPRRYRPCFASRRSCPLHVRSTRLQSGTCSRLRTIRTLSIPIPSSRSEVPSSVALKSSRSTCEHSIQMVAVLQVQGWRSMLYSIPRPLQSLNLTLTQAQLQNQDRNPCRSPYYQSLLLPKTDARTRDSLKSSSPCLDPIRIQRRVPAR